MSGRRGTLAIFITCCAALLLMILPLPEWARLFRPQWVTLTLIYWTIALPHRVGVGSAFVAGIALDVLTGTLLGQHALGLIIVVFVATQIAKRVRVFPLWQQSLGILVLLTIEHLIALWILGITGNSLPQLLYWAVPPIGAILWPWVFVTLRDVRRRFKVT